MSETTSTGDGPARAFVAIAVEPRLAAALSEIQQRLQAALPPGVVRWTRPEQIHLTLKFYGRVDRDRVPELVRCLRRACEPATPMDLSLEALGCFPTKKQPRVIWIGVSGELERLQRLQSRIASETAGFGNHDDDREFRPHLTIGRVADKAGRWPQLGEIVERAPTLKLEAWHIREVLLLESRLLPAGARYAALASIDLKAEG